LASADFEVRTLTFAPRASKTSTQGLIREAAAAGIGAYSEETRRINSFKLYHGLERKGLFDNPQPLVVQSFGGHTIFLKI